MPSRLSPDERRAIRSATLRSLALEIDRLVESDSWLYEDGGSERAVAVRLAKDVAAALDRRAGRLLRAVAEKGGAPQT